MEEQILTSDQESNLQSSVSVKDWFITILLTAIPIVGLIMLLIWAFGGNANINKANWAKATLLWLAIGIVLWIIFGVALGFAFLAVE
nr:hypothetical protein [Saprospiraceae bacterium]